MDENKTQPNDKNIKVLRTYTSDMAEAIRDNEMSVIKIAMAEKEKREQEEIYQKAEGTPTTKILFVVGGIILIAVAIFGSYYLVQKKKEKEIPKNTITNIETFISYDSKSYIDTTNINDVIELRDSIQKEQQDSSVKALFLTKKTDVTSTLITTKDLFSLINSSAPSALTRSISDKFLLGRFLDPNAIENSKNPMFLILQTNDYPLAYASMLDWEETMLKDLYIFFNINISQSNNSLFQKKWNDIIINNKDARILYGEKGEGILYYVFIDKNNFVISNNINALKEIMSRLIIKNPKVL